MKETRSKVRFAGHGNQVSKRMLSYCSSWSNLNTWSNLSICEYVTEVLRTRAPLTLNGNVCKSRCTNITRLVWFSIVHNFYFFTLVILYLQLISYNFHFTFHSSIFSPHRMILIDDLCIYALHNLSSIIYHTQEFNSHTRIAYP